MVLIADLLDYTIGNVRTLDCSTTCCPCTDTSLAVSQILLIKQLITAYFSIFLVKLNGIMINQKV